MGKFASKNAVSTEAIPPKRPLGGDVSTKVPQASVPSDELLQKIDQSARRLFPAAASARAGATAASKEHIDLLSLELWANGDLPERTYFARWDRHLTTCAKCRDRLQDADTRRAG